MGVEGGTWKDLENVEAGRNCKGAGLWGSGDYEFFNYAVLGLVFFPTAKRISTQALSKQFLVKQHFFVHRPIHITSMWFCLLISTGIIFS